MSSPEPAAEPPPGALLLAEIHEQPAALARLLEHEAEFARVAADGARPRRDDVRMVGHGSSDNAAAYGVYAFGLLPGWTALRDSITLTVYYGAQARPARLDGDRPLAVGAHARRRRVRAARAGRPAPSRSR